MKAGGASALLVLALAAALTVAMPQRMLAPGPLIDAHRGIGNDCLACHALGRGVTAARCTACHRLDRIGVTTTTGAPLARGTVMASFHRHLREQRCVVCHRDHRGLTGFRERTRFAHDLLEPAVRNACASCHRAPGDALHRGLTGSCGRCHGSERWTPADFDHAREFVLDPDHRAPCATCHPGGDLGRFTCYGCHAHTPARIAAEHLEEGIRRFDDCARCHRSADEHEARGGGGGEHGEGD